MIRRLLTLVAYMGMVGAFASTIRDIHRLSAFACPGWEAESRGNCEAFARYYAEKGTVLFSVFAIALIVMLVPLLRSTER